MNFKNSFDFKEIRNVLKLSKILTKQIFSCHAQNFFYFFFCLVVVHRKQVKITKKYVCNLLNNKLLIITTIQN